MTIFETDRLYFDEVTEAEIEEVIEIESHKENRDYLWIGTVEEHKDEIADPNHLLLIFHEKTTGETKGYALIRLDFKSHIFEVRRIAITDKGKGYGKESMVGLFRYAFEHTDTNRLWLDVYPDNEIGIKLYESLGMHCDGVLRQNYLAERGYLDQIIYSLLRSEYEAKKMNIRHAGIEDLDRITEVEAMCFPAAEAASKASFEKRLTAYPNHFWVLEKDGEIISFVNGMVTDIPDLNDDMYDDAFMHNEDGAWQMIFGVDTVPECQKRGYAEMVLNHVIEEARKQGRKGLVLTCKDKLEHYYAKFGFINEGLSGSEHGGAVWYQMRLTF